MTAANVHDQVWGTLAQGKKKTKPKERKPTIEEIMKDMQGNTPEAREWAKRAMIDHYLDEYVAGHHEEERRIAAQRMAHKELERQQMLTAWLSPLVEEEERAKDMKETLANLLTLDLKSHMRATAANLGRKHEERAIQWSACCAAQQITRAERYLSDNKRPLKAGRAQGYRIKVIGKENTYREACAREKKGASTDPGRTPQRSHATAIPTMRGEACKRRHALQQDKDLTQWEVTVTQIDQEDTDQWCVAGNR